MSATDPSPADERGYTFRPDLVPDGFPAAEVFGYPPEADTPAARDARANLRCPFKGGACTKLLSAAGTGVCSVRYKAAGFDESLIWATCANRLSGLPFQEALVKHFGARAGDAELVTEVRMKDPDVSFDGVGVLAEEDGTVDLVGIEAQTIDTRGGSIKPMFEAYVAGQPDSWKSRYPGERVVFGVNTTNVWKRLLPQVQNKGRMFADWEAKLYVVLQDAVWQFIRRRMPLKVLSLQERKRADVIWLPWDYTGELLDDGMRATEIGEPVYCTLEQIEQAFVSIHAAQRPKFVETVLGKLGRDNAKLEAARRKAAAEAAQVSIVRDDV